jgi:hypothetical protein
VADEEAPPSAPVVSPPGISISTPSVARRGRASEDPGLPSTSRVEKGITQRDLSSGGCRIYSSSQKKNGNLSRVVNFFRTEPVCLKSKLFERKDLDDGNFLRDVAFC